MKIVVISDTHSMHRKIKNMPQGDMLIHCGDIGGRGTYEEYEDFNEWLGEQSYEHKIVIPGNHDRKFERDPEYRKVITNATVLIDEELTINGIRFYGSPWTPMFCNWAFMGYPDKMKEVWAKIPTGIDVLITHGPPHGVLDEVERDYGDLENTGCRHLKNKVNEIKPLFHLYGHIHEGYGRKAIGRTTFINAATCTEQYKPTNLPQVFEIEKAPDQNDPEPE